MMKKKYLQAMGIQVWKARRHLPFAKQVAQEIVEEPVVEKITEKSATLDWQQLQQQVSQCTACDLHQSRSNAVFGVGNKQADWLIIGDAPDADEDAKGEPFVGRAERLLNNMLLAIGVSRDTVFLVNLLKCRPPNNRDPAADEVACCEKFLVQQIDEIKPKVILAVGRVAAQSLLNSKETIGHIRGKVHQYGQSATPLVATYHPAYLLRSPTEKSKAWSDLILARRASMGHS